VRGVVQDHGGHPIAGAVLTALGGDGWQAGHAVAGPLGGYELTGIARMPFTVIVLAPGYAPQAAVINAGAGGEVGHDFALAPAGGLSGSVRSADDDPMPGATVVLTDAAGTVVAQEVTGHDGDFLLPGLPGGNYTVTATATGHRAASQQVQVNGTMETALLALVAEAGVHGVVRGPSDAPVPGITVSLANNAGEIVASTVTGADGAYQLSGPGDGEHTLVAGGYQPVAAVVQVEDGQTAKVTVRLGPGHIGEPA